jgi:transcriptional regulator with PAS, ATPase and Fis domain
MPTTKSNEAGTQRGDPKNRWTSKRLGAKSALQKEFSTRREALNMITAEQGITQPGKTGARLIIAESRAMREIGNFVQRVAVSEASSFLIEGENGTGKDLVAATLHYQSPRKAGPFLAINCAAIPETLLESELFGYERGPLLTRERRNKDCSSWPIEVRCSWMK